MKAEWKHREYVGIDKPYKLYGKVVEEKGSYYIWFLSHDGDLKKYSKTFRNLTLAKMCVEQMAQNPNVASSK